MFEGVTVGLDVCVMENKKVKASMYMVRHVCIDEQSYRVMFFMDCVCFLGVINIRFNIIAQLNYNNNSFPCFLNPFSGCVRR